MLWTECLCSKNSQVEALMVFGGKAFGRWLGHEGGALSGISILLGRELALLSWSRENIQEVGIHVQTRKRALTKNQICQDLDLVLLSLRNHVKEMFVVKPPNLCSFVTAACAKTTSKMNDRARSLEGRGERWNYKNSKWPILLIYLPFFFNILEYSRLTTLW